jgi:hypothetical protein
LHREHKKKISIGVPKKKRGKEVVASTSTDSPVKNMRSKCVNVAKKTKSKKRLPADLM